MLRFVDISIKLLLKKNKIMITTNSIVKLESFLNGNNSFLRILEASQKEQFYLFVPPLAFETSKADTLPKGPQECSALNIDADNLKAVFFALKRNDSLESET